MKNKELIQEGQLSIFDMQFTEKHISITRTEEMDTEKPILDTKIINMDAKKENEKVAMPLKPTEEQQKFLDKNNIMENENLSRIIIHAKGSITVEIKESDIFTSHYINLEGKEEFSYSNRSPVLPWDKIVYSATKEVPLTEIQETKVQKLITQRKDVKRVVKRKGDVNVIAEHPIGLISITPIGWELPFESINHIECSEDEIYIIPKEVQEIEKADPVDIQMEVKVGDYVQAIHGKEIIEGELYSEYNSGHTFNIIFENGAKHTAIPRMAIRKILKSA